MALAAKQATATIPIVFTTGNDPVRVGLVAALNKPGGNITGVTTMNAELGSKWVGLLHDRRPRQRALPCWSIPEPGPIARKWLRTYRTQPPPSDYSLRSFMPAPAESSKRLLPVPHKDRPGRL